MTINQKHIIDKSFSFCYGHRVHNQRLNTNFTENAKSCLACRHLHGHEGLVKVYIEEIITGANIEKTGMVTDFKHLGWFKNFIDDNLDHKFLMDLKDPLIQNEFTLLFVSKPLDQSDRLIKQKEGHYLPNMTFINNCLEEGNNKFDPESQAIFEKYEGAVFVDFVPTSENIASWLLEIANDKMKELPNIRVAAIEYNETPKSHCRVEAV